METRLVTQDDIQEHCALPDGVTVDGRTILFAGHWHVRRLVPRGDSFVFYDFTIDDKPGRFRPAIVSVTAGPRGQMSFLCPVERNEDGTPLVRTVKGNFVVKPMALTLEMAQRMKDSGV